MNACAPQLGVLKSYKIVNVLLADEPLKVRYMKIRFAHQLLCPFEELKGR